MPGPAPKDRDERSNHRPPTFGEWRDLPPIEEPVLPPLPELEGVKTWNKRTLDMWDAWRQDFATQLYGPSEIGMAIDLAYLHSLAVSERTSSHWAEVRQWADRLMLTPKGKRDARVRLVECKPEVETTSTGPSSAPVLRLVDDAVAS